MAEIPPGFETRQEREREREREKERVHLCKSPVV
jgi:hypothetical protein